MYSKYPQIKNVDNFSSPHSKLAVVRILSLTRLLTLVIRVFTVTVVPILTDYNTKRSIKVVSGFKNLIKGFLQIKRMRKTTNDIFPVASTTKTFTVTIRVKLVRLSLQDFSILAQHLWTRDEPTQTPASLLLRCKGRLQPYQQILDESRSDSRMQTH